MAYRRKSYTYSGGDAIFPIPFNFIEENDIFVYINNEATTDFVIENYQVKLTQIPQELPVTVLIESKTDIDKPIVEWQNTSSLDEENLTLSNEQLLYAQQELYDGLDRFVQIADNVESSLQQINEGVDIVNEKTEDASEYAQLAKDWANKTDGTVDDIEYSSKYYAQQTASTAQTAITNITEAESDSLSSISTAKTGAINEIDDKKEELLNIANTMQYKWNMFDLVVKDHILTEQESVGFALLGTYVTKAAYPDFYNTCVSEKTAGTPTQTQLGDNTITTYNNANGHIFYDIADKAAVDAFYESLGVAWFYGVDTTNERIFLPRGKNYAAYGNTVSTVPVIGNGKTLGYLDQSGNTYSSQCTGASASSYNMLGLKNDSNLSSHFPANTPIIASKDPSKSGLVAQTSNIINGKEGYVYMVVGNTVINSDQALIDAQGLIADGLNQLEEKTDDGLSALSNASNALRQTQITNCLLEVPQRVKVRLDGTSLVLEASSVVIVPYGTKAPTLEIGDPLNGGEIVDISWDEQKLFYFVKYASDKGNGITDINTQNRFVFVNSTQYFDSMPLSRTFSSPTAPSTGSSQWALWYDTTNNNVKYTNDSGTNWIENCSLPFATGFNGSNGWESIDTVFNGVGFIGSTIWADKGIKGLAANGRNADGTFNNIEFETNRVLTANTYNGERNACITITDGYVMLTQYIAANYYESITPPPADLTKSGCWWNPETGQSFTVDTANQKWVQRGVVNLATVTATNTEPYQVTECSTIRRPFQAADVNDLTSYVTETYSNGASWYRVYSDGWCEQGGQIAKGSNNVTVTFLRAYRDINYTALCSSITSNNGVAANGSVGVKNTNTCTFINDLYSYPMGWECKGYIN